MIVIASPFEIRILFSSNFDILDLIPLFRED